jgi:hypothetical protein
MRIAILALLLVGCKHVAEAPKTKAWTDSNAVFRLTFCQPVAGNSACTVEEFSWDGKTARRVEEQIRELEGK